MTPGGYCEPCLWELRSEVEFGLFQLGEYLERWAEFSDWCDDQGRRAA